MNLKAEIIIINTHKTLGENIQNERDTEYFLKFFMQKCWEDLESSALLVFFFKLRYNSFTILC